MASISGVSGGAAILKVFRLGLEWSVVVSYQFSYWCDFGKSGGF
jgi:hypothetical protein